MPTTEENICCRKGMQHGPCVLLDKETNMATVVLDHNVVQTAVSAARDLYADNIQRRYDNNRMHFQAYNQYVLATAGHTGSGNRIVVPACVVCYRMSNDKVVLKRTCALLLQTREVRDKWPDPNGQYVGYKKSTKQLAAALDMELPCDSD